MIKNTSELWMRKSPSPTWVRPESTGVTLAMLPCRRTHQTFSRSMINCTPFHLSIPKHQVTSSSLILTGWMSTGHQAVFLDQYGYRSGQMKQHPNRSFVQPFSRFFKGSQHMAHPHSCHTVTRGCCTCNHISKTLHPSQQYMCPNPSIEDLYKDPNNNIKIPYFQT